MGRVHEQLQYQSSRLRRPLSAEAQKSESRGAVHPRSCGFEADSDYRSIFQSIIVVIDGATARFSRLNR